MAGGLLQLVAYGSQDLFLTGNPQITFFKIVYRRHTNFALESRKLTFNGTPDFGSLSNCNIAMGPDLLYKLYLEISISPGKWSNLDTNNFRSFRWLNWLGHILIKDITFNIGGSQIDKHTGEWYHINNELSQKSGKAEAYAEMIGNTPLYTQIQTNNSTEDTVFFDENIELCIPLQFWFCKNPGLALPLIALQHTSVNIEITFEELNNCMWGSLQTANNYSHSAGSNIFSEKAPSFSDNNQGSCYLYADYIYLDIDERKRFASSAHEYLIETLKIGSSVESSKGKTSEKYTLNFTHPIKEIIWVNQIKDFKNNDFAQSRGGLQHFNYTTEWDYTGFTGTPECHKGTGMVGGRKSQNLWHGLPSVNLPYYSDALEPDYSEKLTIETSNWHKYNNWPERIATTAENSTKKKLGYDNISMYHINNDTLKGNRDSYKLKNIDRMIGSTGIIQSDDYNLNPGTNISIPAQYYGNWSGTHGNAQQSSNLRLLDQGKNPTKSAQIVLNGIDRFSKRNGFYFNTIQPYQHHTNCPAPGINVYSFALEPEEHQPSGSCNFSRINTGTIDVDFETDYLKKNNCVMKAYAVGYNILRIMGGQGQLAYSG